MRYIIMCGGNYQYWETPRQLLKICGEEIVARTIRLLREAGVDDIAISSDNPAFEKFGVPVLKHDNDFTVLSEDGKVTGVDGYWMDGLYPTDEPVTYLLGDVVYSPAAIRTIVDTETNDIEFFASAPPYSDKYIKSWPEPFAFKVVDTDHLYQAKQACKAFAEMGYFWRPPIAWELWTCIKHGVLKNKPDVYEINYTIINDYTCDIDAKADIPLMEKILANEP